MRFSFHLVLLKSLKNTTTELFLELIPIPQLIAAFANIRLTAIIFRVLINDLNLQHV